jgi:signal transduction histidine kinase
LWNADIAAVVNKNGATLNFTLAPACVKSKWFHRCLLGLGVVSSGFVIFALYRLRIRQTHKSLSARFDERTQMARELHDTLLQTLEGSKLVADDAMEESSDPIRMRRAMEQLSGWLGQAVQEGEEALNSLRSSSTQTNGLAEALKRATEECPLVGLEAFFSVTGHAKAIHPVVRDELYRIGFEAIRNACRHSRGKRLEVRLRYGNNLTLQIKDNGVGIDPSIVKHGKEGHLGLQRMRERVARMGGKLTIASSAGSGTEVTIAIPGAIIFRAPGNA